MEALDESWSDRDKSAGDKKDHVTTEEARSFFGVVEEHDGKDVKRLDGIGEEGWRGGHCNQIKIFFFNSICMADFIRDFSFCGTVCEEVRMLNVIPAYCS